RFLSLRLLVLFDGHEAVEVHGVAVGVDDLDLAEHDGDRLVARNVAHDRLKLVALLQRLDEVLGAHAVLARCLNQVLGELFLRDLDLEVLRDPVEEELRAELLLAGFLDLGAVGVVLETVLLLEVTVHLVLDEGLGNGDVGGFEELLDELVASLRALRKGALLLDLVGERLAQLSDRVELTRHLREVVVGLGELALLDDLDRHGNLGVLAGVLAADELRGEGRLLARGERLDGLVCTFEELARTDLVRDALGAVDLLVADLGDEVELDEVALGSWTLDGDEGAEAGAQGVELRVDRGLVDLDRVDRDLQVVVCRDLELGRDVDLDVDLEVAREVLLGRPRGDVGAGL